MKTDTIVYGLRAVIEAVQAEKPINKVFIQKGISGDLSRELEYLLRKKKTSTSYVPVERLNKLTTNNHQGAVALISPINFKNFDDLIEDILQNVETPLFLLLDQVTDVRNFGAIIRTAECTGVNAIIIPKTGSAPINSDTIKTSSGAAFNVPIAKVDHLKDAIYYLQASGIKIVAATEKGSDTIYDIDLNKGSAIIMGAEDKGISNSLLQLADHSAKLPIAGKIGSLNVSVACGVFLYEVLRQRLENTH
ncbi:MAG: 23S rRNA (guanosine(2251)-2'-O)-methyltransferase RlmB [Bacteroidota bacterium]